MADKPKSFKDAPADIRESATRIVKSYSLDMDVMAGAIGAALLAEREKATQAERERCQQVCRQVEQDFLSPEYATPQPASSFAERFACREVERGIVIPETLRLQGVKA
jgi:hypothetical protein